MHILLTDRLSCPRCGPRFGLILLADRMEDRRVLEGRLGCANCRDRFPVAGGFGDLRAPPRSPLPEPPAPPAPDAGETEKLAALLGVTEGPGHLLVAGPAAARAPELAALLDDVEVVAVDAGARALPEAHGVSRLVAGPGLPFFSRALRGVALSGPAVERFTDEAARTVAPGGRVVALEARADSRRRLEAAGLRVLLEDGGVVVAVREAA